MVDISELSKDLVLDMVRDELPDELTEAIYLFGSFCTGYFDSFSDLDIGWFVNKEISVSRKFLLEDKLSEILNRPVDLVVITDLTIDLLLVEVLKSPINYINSFVFSEWFDRNLYKLECFYEDYYKEVF